jgi:Uma2 family endonuclease
MAQRASPYPDLTVDEYLKFEESASVRHEYVGGQLYAFAGASTNHNRLIRNFILSLSSATEGSACEVFFNDLKLRIGESLFYYPDLMVVCDPDNASPLYQSWPCLVVEILSPSTEAADRREKLFAYRQITTLQAYLIVWQDQRRVQRHYRDANGEWANAEVAGTGNVPLTCPEITLTLDDIYRGVEV